MLLGSAALAESPAAPSAVGSEPRVLDLAHPHFSERIATDQPATFDFVRLTVARVVNPKRIGLIFDVAFIADSGLKIRLGGFSLYPPDNPGSFLVSTRHLIDSPGFVVVSLHTATPVDPGTPLSITMGSVALAKGL